MSSEVEGKEVAEVNGEVKLEDKIDDLIDKTESLDSTKFLKEETSKLDASSEIKKDGLTGDEISTKKEEIDTKVEDTLTLPKKSSYKALSDELATIGTDVKNNYSKQDVEKPPSHDSSRTSISRLMNKKLSLEPDSTFSSTRLTSSVKIDEDDLDKEIAARMQAFSSGYKPSTASSYSYLNDPLTNSSSSYTSKVTPYNTSKDASSSYSTSSYYPTGSNPYMTESGANTVKTIFESRIKDLESDLENERLARSKCDKQRMDYQKDLSSVKDKFEDSQQNLSKQIEMNRRREHQLQNISRVLEDSQAQAEAQMSSFKKKHQEIVAELMDQVDNLHKSKQKSEKDKLAAQVEMDGVKNKEEGNNNSKTVLEKQVKSLDDQLKELHMTLNNMEREFAEVQNQKNKYQMEASDFKKKTADLEKHQQEITLAHDTARNENKELTNKLRGIEEKLLHSQEEVKAVSESSNALKEDTEDNKERQSELQRRLNKAMTDVNVWQQKCQGSETLVHPNDVEELKKKFIQKLQESEAKVDATIGKMVALEKARAQALSQSNGLGEEIEKLQNELMLSEKKHKLHDKVVDDWKSKVEGMQNQLEEVNGEARNGSEKTQKVHQLLEEANETIERVRRENKNIHVDLDDMNQQLEYANQKASDFDKLLKKAEAERLEMSSAINDKDLALQKELAKFQRLHLEVDTGKDDLDRRRIDKELEIDALRKSHNQSLANLTMSMEGEAKSKLEALKTTKELEQIISDLELEIANLLKGKMDHEKIHKMYQMQLSDLQALFEDEEQMRKKAEEDLVNHFGKSEALKDEVDVLRLQVESLERNRKMLELEVKEGTTKITDLNNNCNNLSEAKKKLENTFNICRSDNEDQQLTARRIEDALKKSTIEFNILNDEIKNEKAKVAESDKLRRFFEQQVKELGTRLETSEQMSVAGGKSAWSRLEQRVGELEVELEGEKTKSLEKEKSQRKQERRTQEMEIHMDEQQSMQMKLGELCEKMQSKIRAYKKHLDDAEQISELNLAKFRKMQSDLEEAETRANVAEKLVEQLRSRAVASVTGGEDGEVTRARKVKIEE